MNVDTFYSFQLEFLYFVVFFFSKFQKIRISDVSINKFSINNFLTDYPFTSLTWKPVINKLAGVKCPYLHSIFILALFPTLLN